MSWSARLVDNSNANAHAKAIFSRRIPRTSCRRLKGALGSSFLMLSAVALACIGSTAVEADGVPSNATTITILMPEYNETRTLTAYGIQTVWNETRTTTVTIETVVETCRRSSTLTVFIVEGGTTTHALYVWTYETTGTVQKPYIVTVTVTPANVVTEAAYVTRVVPLYLDSETRVTQLASCSTACVSENRGSTTPFLILLAVAGVLSVFMCLKYPREKQERDGFCK